MADERNFELEIITPDRVFWKGEAYMLELNTCLLYTSDAADE